MRYLSSVATGDNVSGFFWFTYFGKGGAIGSFIWEDQIWLYGLVYFIRGEGEGASTGSYMAREGGYNMYRYILYSYLL